MSNYYLILVWIFVIAILTNFFNVYRQEPVDGKLESKMKPVWAFIIFLPLIIWTANRGYVGDTGAYMDSFAEMPVVLSEIPQYISGVTKDKGFYFVSAVIKSIVSEKVEIYFLIIGLLQTYFLIRIYRKYSVNYVISFFLFIASTDYISWMFNGMRQFCAVTITILAFELALEKKYIKAIIIVLIASLFHQSALLVIPFLFICQGKAWNKKTLLFILLIVVAVAYVEQFTNLLDSMLVETQYKNVISDWQGSEDDGTNILRVLVYSIPTILALVGLRFINKENSKIINVCVNMSIVSAGLYVVSMFTSGIFIGRLPIYFSIYNYILLPWEIENMFTKESARIIYILMMIAYVSFYYLQVHVFWGFA